jgi:hypothetical protein
VPVWSVTATENFTIELHDAATLMSRSGPAIHPPETLSGLAAVCMVLRWAGSSAARVEKPREYEIGHAHADRHAGKILHVIRAIACRCNTRAQGGELLPVVRLVVGHSGLSVV